MRQLLTSSTALTTSRHTNTTRSYGRGRRVTTFTAPAPVKTDPARDLVAAVYGWGRIADPVTDPAPCPVAWCVNCLSPITVGEKFYDFGMHQSAAAVVEALSFNGIEDDLPHEVEQRTIKVHVERIEAVEGEDQDLNEPATAVLRFGSGDHIDLSSAKAMEVSAALTKARVSAQGLAARDTVKDGTTGAVSVVRTGNGTLQIGALFTSDGPVVFVNILTVLTAADVREVARHEAPSYRSDSWDLDPAGAAHLAAAVDAAAVLAAADRAVTA